MKSTTNNEFTVYFQKINQNLSRKSLDKRGETEKYHQFF